MQPLTSGFMCISKTMMMRSLPLGLKTQNCDFQKLMDATSYEPLAQKVQLMTTKERVKVRNAHELAWLNALVDG